MDNLYVHLQSDSSDTYYNNNLITDFRNRLSAPLDIDPGSYEVGLVQCSYVFNKPYIKAGFKIGNNSTINQQTAELMYQNGIDTKPETIQYKFETSKDSKDSVPILNVEFNDETTETFKYGSEGSSVHYRYALKSDKVKKPVEIAPGQIFSTDHLNGFIIKSTFLNVVFYRPQSWKQEIVEFTNKLNDELRKYGYWIIDHSVNKLGEYFGVSELKLSNKIRALYRIDDPNSKREFPLVGEELFRLQILHSIHKIPIKVKFNGSINNEQETRLDNLTFRVNEKHDVEIVGLYSIKTCIDIHGLDTLVKIINFYVNGIELALKDNYCYITKKENDMFLKLADSIENMLGITETVEVNEKIRGSFRPFFGHGQQKMYIYCDIIENQHIGGQLAPLLRITNYHGVDGKTTLQEFANHQYVPLKNIIIDQIHMYIRSETGEFLPIEHGSFSSTLHFRKKRI